jgi:hypothetical protein
MTYHKIHRTNNLEFAFRIDRVLKSGDISWRCTVKNCKGRIKTDEHSSASLSLMETATESDSRKIQKQIIRAVVQISKPYLFEMQIHRKAMIFFLYSSQTM